MKALITAFALLIPIVAAVNVSSGKFVRVYGQPPKDNPISSRG